MMTGLRRDRSRWKGNSTASTSPGSPETQHAMAVEHRRGIPTSFCVAIFSILIHSSLAQGPPDSANRSDLSPPIGSIHGPSQSLAGVRPEAYWIWDSGDPNPRNTFLHLRKSFALKDPPQSATAFVSAHAFAELYINGRHVDRVPTNPDPEYQTYEAIDLAPFLRQGANTIAALLYNTGGGLHHRMDARGGFFFQATVTGKSGALSKIHSDRTWRVARARAWDNMTAFRQHDRTIGFRERYDARLSHEGWLESAFDDSGWETAREIGVPPVDPWRHLLVIKGGRTHHEILEPTASWSTNGYRIHDFGKVVTAHPEFAITARQEGVEITLGTSERLNEQRFPVMKDNVDFTDTYITKTGAQSWFPVTWRGFRYLAIEEKDGVSIDAVRARFRSFPVKRAGSFTCSDDRLNRIWETGLWTMQICAHDTWMDTPWREQTQYIAGDTRYNMRYASYAFAPNIRLLHDYNILSGALSQRHSPEGAIRSRYPTGFKLGPKSSTYIPDYQLEWILMLREYHMYFGNRQLIEQVYPNLKRLLHYFEGHVSKERGLLGRVRGWVVLDHPDTYPQDVEGECTAMNCLYFGALKSAAWIARDIMRDESQAVAWEGQAEAIRKAVQEHLWSEGESAFRDGCESSRITQQTQVYALEYGLVPEKSRPEVVKHVVGQGRSCEQSFSYWLLHSLIGHGQEQWALDYIRKHWGDQMKRPDFNGAWHEMWDAGPGMTRSHAWCSGPTALLPEMTLGLEPLEPGWKTFKVQPRLADLEWAEASVATMSGNIRAKAAKFEAGEWQIEAVVPGNSMAIIHIPVLADDRGIITANGHEIWKAGKGVGDRGGIRHRFTRDGFAVFEFPAGTYSIQTVNRDKLKSVKD